MGRALPDMYALALGHRAYISGNAPPTALQPLHVATACCHQQCSTYLCTHKILVLHFSHICSPNCFFGLAAYPRHHVVILVQMTKLMLNMYITQISVVDDRQLKYSTFIPILPWSALGNSSHVLIQCSNPSSFKHIM